MAEPAVAEPAVGEGAEGEGGDEGDFGEIGEDGDFGEDPEGGEFMDKEVSENGKTYYQNENGNAWYWLDEDGDEQYGEPWPSGKPSDDSISGSAREPPEDSSGEWPIEMFGKTAGEPPAGFKDGVDGIWGLPWKEINSAFISALVNNLLSTATKEIGKGAFPPQLPQLEQRSDIPVTRMREARSGGSIFKRYLMASSKLVVQLSATASPTEKLHAEDLQCLTGLQVNVTGMPEGTAMFSASGRKGFEAVEGTMWQNSVNNEIHKGNLSFAIPGLETEIQGQWITVTPSEDESESARGFAQVCAWIEGRQ